MPSEELRPTAEEHDLEEEPPPPFGRTWMRLYLLVLLNLAVLIVVFYIFKRAFA